MKYTNLELLNATIKQLVENWMGANERGDWIDQLLWRIVPLGIIVWILI